jgi:hypothetical protein
MRWQSATPLTTCLSPPISAIPPLKGGSLRPGSGRRPSWPGCAELGRAKLSLPFLAFTGLRPYSGTPVASLVGPPRLACGNSPSASASRTGKACSSVARGVLKQTLPVPFGSGGRASPPLRNFPLSPAAPVGENFLRLPQQGRCPCTPPGCCLDRATPHPAGSSPQVASDQKGLRTVRSAPLCGGCRFHARTVLGRFVGFIGGRAVAQESTRPP